MNNTKIDYDKVFQLFIDSDSDSDIRHPFQQGDYYYASDCCSLISLPIDIADLPYQEQDKPTDTFSILPRESNCNIEINVSELEAKLIPEMVDETFTEEKECKNCDGEGELECNLGHKHDCEDCEGTGKIITLLKQTTNKIPCQTEQYKMFDIYFQYRQLKRLIDACQLLNVETIIMVFKLPNDGNLFICGGAKILIMPTMINDDKDIKIIY